MGKTSGMGFLFSDHYHCIKCGRLVEFLTRIYTPSSGLHSIGICSRCVILLFEGEGGSMKWETIEL